MSSSGPDSERWTEQDEQRLGELLVQKQKGRTNQSRQRTGAPAMTAHRYAFRVEREAVTPVHTTMRVFANGASAGLLTMRNDDGEAVEFMHRVETQPALLEAAKLLLDALNDPGVDDIESWKRRCKAATFKANAAITAAEAGQ